MGLRLTITNTKNEQVFYGTKLYGYGNYDDFILESHKYLYDNGFLDGDERPEAFPYFCEWHKPIFIDNKHLKEFLKYYDRDLRTRRGADGFLELEEIKEILRSKEDYYISWE